VAGQRRQPGHMLDNRREPCVMDLAVEEVVVLFFKQKTAYEMRVTDAARELFVQAPPMGFVAQTLLSFLAIVCLPRQFQVAVVECGVVAYIRRSRWIFGGYLM